jgi:hypothetical protein
MKNPSGDRSRDRSPLGASSGTFNQKVFEQEFALAGAEWTTAANARHFALGRRLWWGFKTDNFVLCRADGAMEQRRHRLRHSQGLAIRPAEKKRQFNGSDLTSSQFTAIVK